MLGALNVVAQAVGMLTALLLIFAGSWKSGVSLILLIAIGHTFFRLLHHGFMSVHLKIFKPTAQSLGEAPRSWLIFGSMCSIAYIFAVLVTSWFLWTQQ